MALEEEFETEIPDEDAEKITTVQQAIDYINEHAARPDLHGLHLGQGAADPANRLSSGLLPKVHP